MFPSLRRSQEKRHPSAAGRKQRSAGCVCRLVLVYIAIGVGCSRAPKDYPTGGLDIPREFDAGYVPPEGASARLLLRNDYATPVEIKGVSSSCGCVAVKCPARVEGRSDAWLEVRLKGCSEFAMRGAELAIETTPGGLRRVAITFRSGVLPQFDQAVFRATASGKGSSSDAFHSTLFVRTTTANQVVKCSAQDDAAIEFDQLRPEGPVRSVSANAALVQVAGIHALPVRIVKNSEAATHSFVSVVRATVAIDGIDHVIPLRFIDEGHRPPRVLPDRSIITYTSTDELSEKWRHFVINCDARCNCEVISADD